MKFWNAFLLILLLAAPSLAQAPYYGYPFYGYPPPDIFMPYYSAMNPYYSAMYPDYSYPNSYPFYTSPIMPYYLQPPYAGPSQPMNTDAIIGLQGNVQQLTNEVERLENELTEANSPPAQVYVVEPAQTVTAPEKAAEPEQTASAREKVTEPAAPARPYALIFKDGRRIDAQGYAILGDTLWIVTPGNSIKVALSDLDVDTTRRENARRGIDFPPV